MAPNASTTDSGNKESLSKDFNSSKNVKPIKWWQWVFMYPTLIIAIAGAIPTVLGYYKSWKIGVPFDKTQIALEQNRLWQKNYECSNNEFRSVKNNLNIEVGTIICLSGDVLIKVQIPDAKPMFWWVGLKTFESNDQAGIDLWFIDRAQAEEKFTPIVVAQNNSVVLCQKWLDNGRLLRRVDTQGKGCFDEVINTYTGQIEKRDSAPCDGRC
ncbi:MAG TPA: hypothetical protein PK820_09775 [Candidatus Competibacteraceae bacterium]|mgnify:CR=1 FL=1|nr:hypothetical protein [Candidatus Competibacteraceae bacterium]MCP5134173.1 hypothetical protein [Gammaproteobacteria bacterium]HPF59067.1 hypothetical protein [Candidatus Competibacteraceae bacterium]HRX70656.1 hypothetical protein [Candidatus Competibacteraceae bacterium]